MIQTTTKAIVLRRTNYQEADRILNVLTSDHGKVSVIAKGARRSKSKLAGGIELFAVNTLSYIKGKSDLHTLTSSRVDKQFSEIGKNIERTMKAYDFIKAIDRVVAENADESEYFDVLAEGLSGLNDDNVSIELSELWFYMHMLLRSGIQPDLQQDSAGEKLLPDQTYEFDVADMSFMQAPSGSLSAPHIKLLRLVSHMSRAQNLSKLEAPQDIISICCVLTRRMAEHHLL